LLEGTGIPEQLAIYFRAACILSVWVLEAFKEFHRHEMKQALEFLAYHTWKESLFVLVNGGNGGGQYLACNDWLVF